MSRTVTVLLLLTIKKQPVMSLWRKDLASEFKDTALAKTKEARIAAGVTVGRNKVFIGGESGLLVALDAKTGDVAWHAIASGELLSLPTVSEDVCSCAYQ